MNLMNLLVKDVIPFAAQNNLDLLFIIRLIDYKLTIIKLNEDSDFEVDTYLNNVKILNSLFMLMGLATDYSDKERMAYDNNVVSALSGNKERFIKYREYKLSVIKERCAEYLEKFEEYIELESYEK